MPGASHSRRGFIRNAAVALTGASLIPLRLRAEAAPVSPPGPPVGIPSETSREYWIVVAERLARPVLENLAARTLKKNMPVEQRKGSCNEECSHLEAFARLLSGIAPWLERDRPEPWLRLARESLDAATDPASPDYLNYTKGTQPLVDCAYLALAFLRAPESLWTSLDVRVKANVIAALKKTRAIKPHQSNWLLFAASVEAFLHKAGEPVVRARVDEALVKHGLWYKGDGIYGDGAEFHCDYYNSFVIQPMLVDVVTVFSGDAAWGPLAPEILKRARRHAAIQERQISPEGAYPVIGRSSAYRFGAFHALAQSALLRTLPEGVSPAQVRCAMTTMIRRQLSSPENFDAAGWLRIGFNGHQPALGDYYVSTGSLYLCANALLPLGLGPDDPFWSAPDALWTQAKVWSGVDIPGDHSIA